MAFNRKHHLFVVANILGFFVHVVWFFIELNYPRNDVDTALFNSDRSLLVNFEGYDNNNLGSNHSELIVPNIVHLIYLKKRIFRFHEMMCIFSIFLNQRPDKIMIHCETCDFKGYYWKRVMSKRSLRRIIQINKIPMKRRIFNRLTGYIHHRADVWRLLILMQYGGIYVDNDIFVVNSLDKFRRYEMTVGFENMTEHVMGNQVLIAHRNARFLRICYDTYRTSYNRHKWYYNAGELPGQILKNHTYLAHFVPEKFGQAMWYQHLYTRVWPGWRDMFTYHLLINHRNNLDTKNFAIFKEFDERRIINNNSTFGEMGRDVLYRIKL